MNNYLSDTAQYTVKSLLSNEQSVYIFIKDNKEFLIYCNQRPTLEDLTTVVTVFYSAYGMPDRIEYHADTVTLDIKKARKKYIGLNMEKIYQKIIKKYGSLANSPYAFGNYLRTVYKDNSVDIYFNKQLSATMDESDRQLSNDNSVLKDPMLIAKAIRSLDEKGEMDSEIKENYKALFEFILVNNFEGA